MLLEPATSSSGSAFAGRGTAAAAGARCGACKVPPCCVTQQRVARLARRSPAARDAPRIARSQTGSARETGSPRPGARVGRLALDRHQPAIAPRCRAAAPRSAVPRCRGGADRSAVPGRTLLDHLAGIHHQHARADLAMTPRSWLIRMTAVPRSRFSPRSRSRICAWIVTSSAVVGSSAMSSDGLVGEAHRQHHALAHAAGELMRERIHRALRRRRRPCAQQDDRAAARRRRGEAAMRRHRLDELPGDAQHRVQRRHRVLEHHGDLAPAHGANSFLVEMREVAAA